MGKCATQKKILGELELEDGSNNQTEELENPLPNVGRITFKAWLSRGSYRQQAIIYPQDL